ncbi:MAG: phosphoglycolate phosphatase [Burkholderiaceae bacterium]|nr:phosphoglycolate phosphatase [Burkholderiaceae bacterium]
MTSALAPPKALVLDLDGTLVDTVGDFTIALNAMLAALDRRPVTRAQVTLWVGKGTQHLIDAALGLAAASVADPKAQALRQQAWAHYQKAYLAVNGQHSALYPGVREGLAQLAQMNLPLACLTNKPLAFATPLMRQMDLARHFRHVFGGDSFARKKPDPLPLLKTCEALQCASAQVWMIGDSSNDAQAARAAGCPVLLTTYGYNHGQPVQAAGADALLDSLAELPALVAAAAARPLPAPPSPRC